MRYRFLVLLGLVMLPIFAASFVSIRLVDSRMSERIVADLANVRRLEAARIEDRLDEYRRDAASLAGGPHVRAFTADVLDVRAGVRPEGEPIGGFDGFALIDANADRPLDELLAAVQRKARTAGSEVVELSIVGPDGELLGATDGYVWAPYRPELFDEVLEIGESEFGNAFRAEGGEDRVGLVTPIVADDGRLVGTMAMEIRLAPVIDLVVEHEGFGETSEAHIAQPDARGDAEFITLLRFERDAAFSKVVPQVKGLPINVSLESPDGQTIRSPDYRGVDSILSIETIEATGWGLVVKIDAAEAFAPVSEVRRVIMLAGLATASAMIVGWMVFVNPLSRRLAKTAAAAARVAAGEHRSPIADRSSDEIGDMARSIDRLANDLADDIRRRTEVEDRLRYQAGHDGLTGLVTRRNVTEFVGGLTADAPSPTSVLFLDLDGFKTVNDTFGHQIGDEVLVEVASRLTDTARVHSERSVVARWGGDEFVVVLPGVPAEEADRAAADIRDAFLTPITTDRATHNIRCSIGSATSTSSEDSAVDLIRDADVSMFAHKQASKGLQVISSATLREVEIALEQDRIEVHYQPIVESQPATPPTMYGVEALARLCTEDGTLLPPAEFLPAIRDNHLGAALDERVASTAFSDLARWRELGLVDARFRLSVNVCGASSRDPEIVARLRKRSLRTGIPLSSIVLELSEEIRELDSRVLDELRTLGVQLAVDDVGLNHSNMDRLLDVRANVAKIDRRWLGHSGDSPVREHLVLMQLITLCDALGMNVIAEGVETSQQVDLLRQHGITLFQGFHFDRPLTRTTIEARLATNTNTPEHNNNHAYPSQRTDSLFV